MIRWDVRLSMIGCCMIEVEGHAGQAEKGEDIVCAGVSAVVQGLFGFVRDVLHESEVYEWTLEPGRAVLRCVWTPEVEGAFLCARKALELMTGRYPEFIREGCYAPV